MNTMKTTLAFGILLVGIGGSPQEDAPTQEISSEIHATQTGLQQRNCRRTRDWKILIESQKARKT